MSYRTCTRCVLDNHNTDIVFDTEGICNYCHEYDTKQKNALRNKTDVSVLLKKIKQKGKGKKYDCLVGISGGLDSSYLLYYIKQSGLRPLAVHYDSGWDTDKAINNMNALVKGLDIDLYNYVVDWNESKDIMLAYMKAGVVDLEIPTDHSFLASLYRVAEKHNIQYIITGHNHATEGIMPGNWIFNKGDAANLLDIYRHFGTKTKFNTFSVMPLWKKFYYYNIRRIENIHLLNDISYNKEQARALLEQQLGWVDHPVKHGESIWTRFYQCYILPRRFGIDKRKAHLSNLICSGQITREQALAQLQQPIYDPQLLAADMDFILKKFGISVEQFKQYMQVEKREHKAFKTEQTIKHIYRGIRIITGGNKSILHIFNSW